MSEHHFDDHDNGWDHGNHYYFFCGGDSDFSFTDRDGKIFGWIALIFGAFILFGLLAL